jgi:hypothetical protein
LKSAIARRETEPTERLTFLEREFCSANQQYFNAKYQCGPFFVVKAEMDIFAGVKPCFMSDLGGPILLKKWTAKWTPPDQRKRGKN